MVTWGKVLDLDELYELCGAETAMRALGAGNAGTAISPG